MKKTTISVFILTFFAFIWQVKAQFSEGFETGIPVSWTIINNGDPNGWVQNSTPSGGAYEGTSVAGILYNSTTAHDDYLITPQIAVNIGVNDRISYYIKSRSSFYLEPFEVLLSTSGTAAVDFNVVLQASTEAPNAWTQYVFDLSAYDGQSVYIAIRATGLDEFELFVDNVVNDGYPTDILDYYNLQWPPNGNVDILNPSYTVYAQAYEAGLTDVTSGQAAGISCWIGYSISDTNPSGTGWTWVPATFNVEVGNNDEYLLDLGTSISSPGTYYYASRWSLNGGPYTYGGIQSDGSYGGQWGDSGNISGILTINPIVNDNFADALPITCGGNYIGDTSLATLDEDDAPDGFGADMDAPNVWYYYDSSIEGAADVTIDLCPSSYDTSFLVYTGTSGNLTLVAGNDDNNSVCTSAGTRSYGTFTANGTDIYYIAIEGWNSGSVGAFDMTITCTASCTPAQTNQDCASALSASVDGVPFSIDNTCATVNPVQTSCDSFSNISDVWYTFVAPSSGTVDITASLGTATAVHMAVYSGACGSLTTEDCSSAEPTASLSLTGLTPGNTYYLQLWNNGSEEGTFDVTLSDPNLSVSEIDNENLFNYYPNPVNNVLYIKAQKNIESIVVYNIFGQKVLSTSPIASTEELLVTNLPIGSYFVKVTAEGVSKTVRIIKQ